MHLPDQIAFIDVETTGLRPGVEHIAELAVVKLEGGRTSRWNTAINAFAGGHAPSFWRAADTEWDEAPRFATIAATLAARLERCLLVAHIARFDLSFLRAEFEGAGIAFDPRIVCSVMLSRRLCPDLERHDLDSLTRAHRLPVTVRQRALPDADLLHAWWCRVVAPMAPPIVSHALRTLLGGPLLPAALDPTMVAALPDTPGAFAMLDANGTVLHAAAANNLRTHDTHYFRVAHASGRALKIAHRVRRIDWHATGGILGARLHALAWPVSRARPIAPVTWRFSPELVPCIALVECGDGKESLGCFDSPRKARLAVARIATRDGLCRCLLGDETAGALAVDATNCCGALADSVAKPRTLLRIFSALRPLRTAAWPHAGTITLRVRGELFVIDRWRFVGSARVDADVHELLAQHVPDFDPRAFRLLARALARARPAATVLLADGPERLFTRSYSELRE